MNYNALYLGSQTGGQIDFRDAIVRDLHYQPAGGEGDMVEDVIRAALQGMPPEIEAWLEAAGQVCGRTSQQNGDRVRQPGYLTCQPEASGETWRSPLRSAALQVLPAHSMREAEEVAAPLERQRGRTWLQIRLERLNYWEAAQEVPVLASQVVGNGCTTGQPPNHLGIDAGLTAGSLPASLDFEISNAGTGALGNLWLGIDSRIESPRSYHLECEAMGSLGAGVSTISRGDFSGGGGLTYSGSPGTETRSGVYPLDGLDLTYGYNRAYRALLLATDVSAGLQGWVQLVHDGVALVRGPVTALSDGVSDLGVLTLPPWPYDPGTIYTPESVGLELWLYQEDGTPEAALDAIKLLPVDGGSLMLADLGGGLPVGETIAYRGGRLISYQGGRAIEGEYYASHHLRGEGLRLHPGEHARLHLVWERSGGGFDARDSVVVSLYYRRRQSWI